MEYIDRILELAKKYNSIQLYPPADIKLILRSENALIDFSFPKALKDIYKITNGIGFLDYCLLGCRNKRIADISETTTDLWKLRNELTLKFYCFMTTSAGEYWGMLKSDNSAYKPVAYLSSLEEGNDHFFIVNSSFDNFMNDLLNNIESTLEKDPNEIYINNENWPSNLKKRVAFDPDLIKIYDSKTYLYLYGNDNFVLKRIEEAIGK